MKKLNIQTKTITAVFSIAFALFFLVVVSGCSEDNSVSLWNTSNYNPKVTPVLDTLLPGVEALSGITEITIKGKNFSSVAGENIVFFNSTPAKILSATENTLTVLCPFNLGDSLKLNESVRIAVNKAQLFSRTYKLVVRSGVIRVADFTTAETNYSPAAVTIDKNGDVFVSTVNNGVKKVSKADGSLSDYIPRGKEDFWSGMKFGSNHDIYTARKKNGIWKITEGQVPTAAPWVALDKTSRVINDLDFDSKGNIFCGGLGTANKGTDNQPKVYKINSNKVITTYTFDCAVVSVRVFGGYVYFAGAKGAQQGVWRFKINATDDLEGEELYFDYTATGKLGSISNINFTEEGDMYLGIAYTDIDSKVDPVVMVKAGSLTASALYPDVIFNNTGNYYQSSLVNMCWGEGQANFYFSREESKEIKQNLAAVVKVEVLGKKGAPFYGNSL